MHKVKCRYEKAYGGGDNLFILGDSVAVALGLLSEYSGKITLIYMDPPFCTGEKFKVKSVAAYDDTMKESEYIDMMRKILVSAVELLCDEGSLYLHIDYRMSGKIRMLLDEVFSEQSFMNEIIWSYNSGGRTKKHFPRKHDTIFLYSKTSKPYFNIEASGKSRGKIRRNNMKKSFDVNGLVYYSIITGGKEYRYYENEPVYPTDVWTDISHLHQRDRERVNYPTQKPLALLERIIGVSSYKDAYVCDFFSGSGTTAAASEKLGRKWIAVDNSPLALFTLQKRLMNERTPMCIDYGDGPQLLEADISKEADNYKVSLHDKDTEIMYISVGYIDDGTFFSVEYSSSDKIAIPRFSVEKNIVLHVAALNAKHAFFAVD